MNRLNVNRYIHGHRFNKDFMTDYTEDTIDQKKISFTNGSYYRCSA
jgi:hypothetical protein